MYMWLNSMIVLKIPVPRPSDSVELRCGVLYSGCQCTKRDGLQQDCPRSHCQGRPECMAFPAPICVPSGNAPLHRSPPSPPPKRINRNATHIKPNDKPILHKKSRATMFLDMAREGYIEHPCTSKRTPGYCKIHSEIK